MPDKPLEQACDARVCIHTDQILDSCMDKDCVEDLRVYLTRESQAALDRATGAKTRCCSRAWRSSRWPISAGTMRST